ncbi:6-bladed beta-propeller [Rhodohalobacter mucosus]|nr:6-bladed beta-propeller [Rhodohalobacter mucosus]
MSNIKTTIFRSVLFVILILFMMGCSHEDASNIPELENLLVVSDEENSLLTIFLEKEAVFASSEHNLIGRLGQFDIDDDGQLYIADAMQHRVHVFDQSGRYLTHFGREGSGPGEFRAMGGPKFSNGYIHVYDPMMMRLSTFSLDTYEESGTIHIQAINKREVAWLDGLMQSGFVFINPDRFLVNFTSRLVPNPSYEGYNLNNRFRIYHLMDRNRKLELDSLFTLPAYKALSATVEGQYRFTQFEFLGSTLITTSENAIYMARSGEFLIKVYDAAGNYQRTYYAPYQNAVFTREDAISQQISDYEEGVFEWRVSVIENAPEEQIPDTWPALEDILVDDRGRLWVATIIEDLDSHEWWVVDESGELITQFEWPRDEPIEVVKNGYAYTRQTDKETGLQVIVKYRIELEERR